MSYLKIWIHLVWATKNREPVLSKEVRCLLFHHIRENAKVKDIHLDFINGHLDHVHALISLGSDQTISRVTQLLKGEFSYWINKQNILRGRFEWQDDYCALSVSDRDVNMIREYIKNQEVHHWKRSFAEEYEAMLGQHGLIALGG